MSICVHVCVYMHVCVTWLRGTDLLPQRHWEHPLFLPWRALGEPGPTVAMPHFLAAKFHPHLPSLQEGIQFSEGGRAESPLLMQPRLQESSRAGQPCSPRAEQVNTHHAGQAALLAVEIHSCTQGTTDCEMPINLESPLNFTNNN